MAFSASKPTRSEERFGNDPPRVHGLSATLSAGHAHFRGRRTDVARAQGADASTQDRQSRRAARLLVTGKIARGLLRVAHFPPSERNWKRRKSGRHSEFNAGSDGNRSAGFCDRSRRNSGGHRKWGERHFGSRTRPRSSLSHAD